MSARILSRSRTASIDPMVEERDFSSSDTSTTATCTSLTAIEGSPARRSLAGTAGPQVRIGGPSAGTGILPGLLPGALSGTLPRVLRGRVLAALGGIAAV